MYVLVVNNEEELLKIAKDKGLTVIRLDSIDDEVDDIISLNNKKSVYDILITLGIKTHIKGFEYLKYIFESGMNCQLPVTKTIYPIIAKNFNTTPSRVERAIRHAIENAHYDPEIYNLYLKIFGHFGGNPTNQQFIRGLDLYLKEYNILK